MISLQKNIHTCKVNTGWATRNQSERIFSPDQIVCPAWNQVDSAGRPACSYSFKDTTAGCNSATDRSNVENFLRPMNFSSVTLSNYGLEGNSQCYDTQQPYIVQRQTPYKGLSVDNRAFYSQQLRKQQWLNISARTRENRRLSGNT
jgi:hypothetical protein